MEGANPLGGAAAHRHPLALLALLAVDGIMSRDKLIAYLWPERDTESSRNLLKTGVHDLRKLLGDRVLRSTGDQVSLDLDALPCDVAEFEAAVASKDYEKATALYGGPFLDGFFLKDASEFEHWCDARRARLAGSYERARTLLGAQPRRTPSGPARRVDGPPPERLPRPRRRRWLAAAALLLVAGLTAAAIALRASPGEAPGFGPSPLAVILPDSVRGSALLFDGATGHASTRPGTLVTRETDDIGVHLMLRWDGPTGHPYQMVYYNGHGGVSGWGVMVIGKDHEQPDGTIAMIAGGIKVVATPLVLTPGKWQRLHAERRDGRMTVWLDDRRHELGDFPVTPLGQRYAAVERTSVGGDGTFDEPAGVFRGAIDGVSAMNLSSNYSFDRLFFDEGHGRRTIGIKGMVMHLGKTQWTQGAPVEPQRGFWTRLEQLCGHTYAGKLVEGQAQDSVMRATALLLQVRSCTPVEMRIALHVGSNRSRTWILTRTAGGLRLKHQHRHEDGTFDAVTNYGGDTRDSGSLGRQEFFADAHTATLIPAARANVWTIEVESGQKLAYALRREGTDRRVRLEFDLKGDLAAPPPPWGERP